MTKVIGVIDDDESIRDSVKALLRSAGYRVMTYESAEFFLESGAAAGTACLILDIRMPGMDGPELQLRLRAASSRIPIIFVTAHEDSPVRERVLRAGAVEVLNKPFLPDALLASVQVALGQEAQ